MTRSDTRVRRAWKRRAELGLAAGIAVTLLAPIAAGAQQSLAQRVAGVNGEAELRFASRPGVCGNGEGNISFNSPGESSTVGIRGRGWNYDCEPGPVRVRLSVAGGAVTKIRTYVGQSENPVLASGVTDLGVVGAREAADYFLGLARSAGEKVARKAIMPVALADSVTAWPQLLELARDRGRPIDVRKPALFWTGQLGGVEVLDPVRAMATDTSEDESLRKHATFVLSQLPDGAGREALLDIARNGGTTSVRKQALFWAGQAGTPTSDLLKLYREFHDPELQRQMIFVLSQRDDSAAIDGLIDIARNDPDHSMRKRAFFWLGQKDDPRVIALLTSILEK
jgi:HEAT repeat protein